MPLPPAHVLLGAAAAELVSAATPVERYRAWVVGAAFALLPDLDYGIRLLTGEFAPIERVALHSIAATVGVVLVVSVVAGGRWAAVAGAGYVSHLMADLLQQQARTSVALFWPLQQRGMEPLLPLFPNVLLERGGGIRGAAEGLLQPWAFAALLQSTAIAAGIFFGVLVLTGWVRGRRRSATGREYPEGG